MEKNMPKNKMYTDYKKRLDIHGTVLYPAMMVAPVQEDILEEHSAPARKKALSGSNEAELRRRYSGRRQRCRVHCVRRFVHPCLRRCGVRRRGRGSVKRAF